MRDLDALASKLEAVGRAFVEAQKTVQQSATTRGSTAANPWDAVASARDQLDLLRTNGASVNEILEARLALARAQSTQTRADSLLNPMQGPPLPPGWQNTPWDKLQLANNRLRAMDPSSPQYKGAQLDQIRAQRAVDLANKDLAGPPPPPDPRRQVLMDTRLRLGPVSQLVGDLHKSGLINVDNILDGIDKMSQKPGFMGIVGRTASMLLGGGGTIANAAISAGMAYVDAMRARDKSIANGYFSGGGMQGYGQAAGLGSFLDMSPEEVGQMARDLGHKLQGGGYAAARLRMEGIIDRGDLVDVNKFPNLVKTIQAIHSGKLSELDTMRVVNDLGMPQLGRFRNMGDDTFNNLMNSMGNQMNQAVSPGMEEANATTSALFNKGTHIFTDYWDSMKFDLYRMTHANKILKEKGYGEWFKQSAMIALRLTNGWMRYFDDGKDIGGNSKSNTDATKENTEAVKELGRTLKDQQELIGGGTRTRGAMMLHLKGFMFEDAAKSNTMKMGGYSIG